MSFALGREGSGGCSDDDRSMARVAWVAFGWVIAFLGWHVVWYVTGLGFPDPGDRSGTARADAYGGQAVIIAMTVAGVLLPLAFGMRWGRRIPRWLLLAFGWTGFAVLAVRTIAGAVDTVLRLSGVQGGLTGLTAEQVMGTADPRLWDWIAGYTTDALFAIGAITFGLATLEFQRATGRPDGLDRAARMV